MKKLFYIIFIITSITSLLSECQNNLNQATKTVLENAANLKKDLSNISPEIKSASTNISIEQIVQLFLIQKTSKNYLTEYFNFSQDSYKQLELAANLFAQFEKIDDWINYLAVHHQMVYAIQNVLNQLKNSDEKYIFCAEIGNKIITTFRNSILQLDQEGTVSKNDILSLTYASQDYVKLFEIYLY